MIKKHYKVSLWHGLVVIAFLLPGLALAGNRFPKPTVVEDRIESNRVQVKWEKQKNVDHYALRLFDKSCEDRIKRYIIHKKKTKKVLKDLSADTKYCIRMRAFYKNGTHDKFSKRVKFRTLAEEDQSDEPPDEDPDDNEDNPDENPDENPDDDTDETPDDDSDDNQDDQDDGDTNVPPVEDMPTNQFGVNFIRFYGDETEAMAAKTDPAVIEADFTSAGIGYFRQLTSADLLWDLVEPSNDVFTFTESDAVLNTTTRVPIVDLFSYQYADSTTPWDALMGDTTPEKTLTPEAEDYITTVVERYKDVVTYWEIGNEMAHWELTEGDAFTAEEQALWLEAVALEIREHDPDAQIVLPGMIHITTTNVDDWLEPVVTTAGTEWFDVVNYHYYGRWQMYAAARAALQTELEELGIADKPVWMTETGTSSDPTNTRLTSYPNSETEQAADIFRRALLAYAAGDDLVIWHTYIGNDDTGEEFRYFGLINEDLSNTPAYYATKLLTTELLPLGTVEPLSDFTYKVTRYDGEIRYVAWSGTTTSWTLPEGVTAMTSVIPDESGNYTWTNVTAGHTVSLTTTPIILR